MNPDQISAIAPAIRGVLVDSNHCATFVVEGQPSKWVQYSDGLINAAYPLDADPEDMLRTRGAVLDSWNSKQFLTARLDVADARAIAKWIDAYFDEVLVVGPDYPVSISVERLKS